MIIKGIFRRYERWNPVHPTIGLFWGVGVGIGCGIGWGPGFGPEVIGYVGAGCGIGFSVGVTVAGIGIGLPVNGVEQIPHNETVHAPASMTSSGTLKLARSNALSMMHTVTIGLKHFAPYMSLLTKKTIGCISSLQYKASLLQPIEPNKLNRILLSHVKSTVESFQGFRDQGWPPGQGWED
ncbi:uncharacterized protein LOC110019106 [Phalaenopsis equestris]|uniref:uncharacterized protein LOC110019106 n=1 Tax=Phalaenopsis equestris TaxID=78828 RepID=UPI0009E38E67|nr:uncharacterized protein LOC110019106 [Phalaenopsis equestris]